MSQSSSYPNPDFPYGPAPTESKLSANGRKEWLVLLKEFPAKLEITLADLQPNQLATCYRQWTITQIVHHLADAQMNWFLRFKQGLTTLRPTIVPFDESVWSGLADALGADVTSSLQIIGGINARWFDLCQYMPDEDFGRTLHHPEREQDLTLDQAITLSTWHCYHHRAQIQWMRENLWPVAN